RYTGFHAGRGPVSQLNESRRRGKFGLPPTGVHVSPYFCHSCVTTTLVLMSYTKLMDIYEQSLQLHKDKKGNITTALRGEVPPESLKQLYSPGVAEASRYAAGSAEKLREVSWTNNLVAVISEGTSVLGLGDIGPEG